MTPRVWGDPPSSREYRRRRAFALACTLAWAVAWLALALFVYVATH